MADELTLEQKRAIAMASARARMAETPAAPPPEDFSKKLQREKPATRFLMGAPELALQIATTGGREAIAGLSGIAAPAAKLYGMTDKSPAEVVESVREFIPAFEPKSGPGKHAAEVAGKAMAGVAATGEALGDLAMKGPRMTRTEFLQGTKPISQEEYDARPETGSPFIASLARTAPDAFLAATGVRGAKPAAPASKVINAPPPVSAISEIADLFRKGGPERILTRWQREKIGPLERQEQVVAALEGPNAQVLVPGSKPTAAEAVSQVPAGSPVVAHQGVIAKTSGGPSAAFGERLIEQTKAQAAAAKKVKDELGPVREAALNKANIRGARDAVVEAPELPGHVRLYRGESKAPADQGKWYTTNFKAAERYADESGMAMSYIDLPTEVAASLKNGPDSFFLPPDVAAKAVTPIGMKVGRVVSKLDELAGKPGASTLETKALARVREKLLEKTKGGLINANDLYTIRKEVGNDIKAMSKETGNWDKKTTAGAEREIQLAIDDAIEAVAPGWKAEYMTKYAEGMKPIGLDKARTKAAKKPPQRTNVSGPPIGQAAKPESPNLLSRAAMFANFLMKQRARRIQNEIEALAADRYLHPEKLAQALRGSSKPIPGPTRATTKPALVAATAEQERRRKLAEALRK